MSHCFRGSSGYGETVYAAFIKYGVVSGGYDTYNPTESLYFEHRALESSYAVATATAVFTNIFVMSTKVSARIADKNS